MGEELRTKLETIVKSQRGLRHSIVECPDSSRHLGMVVLESSEVDIVVGHYHAPLDLIQSLNTLQWIHYMGKGKKSFRSWSQVV